MFHFFCTFDFVMIRKSLLLSTLMCCATTMAQPKFVPDAEIIKTGEVRFQYPHTVVFGFTNRGNKPLHIKKVHPSCGCTKVTYTPGNIPPGERGEIVVVYDAAMLGTFSKHVEVYTNACKEPEFLSLQGRVVTELSDYSKDFPINLGNVRMSTNLVEFEQLKSGGVYSAELHVVNTERTPYRPMLMHLPSYMRAEYEPEDIPAGKTGVIRLILDSKGLPSMGLNQTSIYLARYMGDKIGDGNEIVVSSVLLPPVNSSNVGAFASKMRLSTEEIFMNMADKKMVAEVSLANDGKAPLTVHNLQVFNSAVEVSLSNRKIAPGGTAKMKVKMNKKLIGRFKARPRILLVTDDPETPVKIVNIIIDK